MKNAIKAGKPAGAEGLAAAVNPAFKSIAELTRETLLSAFVATSTGADMKEKQNQRAVDNVAALPDVIRNGVEDAMVAAMRQVERNPEPNAARPVFDGGRA
jgi:DNA-binding FadR family transcriptional regulator